MATADDTTAELVKLGETETVGVEDGDNGGVWDVHADFHDGGADEDVDVAAVELLHHFLFFFWFHFAVEDVDSEVRKDVCGKVFVFFFHRAEWGFFVLADARAEDVCLMSFVDFFTDVVVCFLCAVCGEEGCFDRFATFRHFFNDANI